MMHKCVKCNAIVEEYIGSYCTKCLSETRVENPDIKPELEPVPRSGVKNHVDLKNYLQELLENLELDEIKIDLSGPHSLHLHYLYNICLKQQERIDVLEQELEDFKNAMGY